MAQPRYMQIKLALCQRIEDGELKPGDRVPSENELVSEFAVSRMTARRALLELAETGLLLRTQGLGSFVADKRPMSSVTQVRDIAEEISQRGHRHSGVVHCVEQRVADRAVAIQLGLAEGAAVFFSLIVHSENGQPVLRESRYVNPARVPLYLEQDFSKYTPSAYLSQIAPLTEAEHCVEAVNADEQAAKQLHIAVNSACLRITRRTFSDKGVVALAELLHPGERYRLGNRFNI